MSGLGDLPGGIFLSYASAVSGDGEVVVGGSASGSATLYAGTYSEAFRWTSRSGMVGIGDLPGGPFFGQAVGVSLDGAVVVGGSFLASEFVPFRWEAANGMISLPAQSPSSAYCIAAESFSIGGGSPTSLGAFRYSPSSGTVSLGDLPGGTSSGGAYGVSDDGEVYVGRTESALGEEAVVWIAGSGPIALPELAGGPVNANCMSVTGDGRFVVGWSTSGIGREAVLWRLPSSMCRIADILAAQGVVVDGWNLVMARGVTAVGGMLMVVGRGANPEGNEEGWLATIPIAAVLADLNGDCVVSGGDLAILLGAWGSSDLLADLDQDGDVGGADLALLLGAWTG